MNITITLPKADPTDVGIWRAALQQAYDIIMCETAHRDVRYEPVRTLAEALRRAQDTLSCEACGNRGWLVATVDGRQRIERCDACQAVYDGTLFVHDDAWAVEQARAAGLVFAKDLKGHSRMNRNALVKAIKVRIKAEHLPRYLVSMAETFADRIMSGERIGWLEGIEEEVRS